jgi:hypothetical protein
VLASPICEFVSLTLLAQVNLLFCSSRAEMELSKKTAILYLTNQLFRVYFRVRRPVYAHFSIVITFPVADQQVEPVEAVDPRHRQQRCPLSDLLDGRQGHL